MQYWLPTERVEGIHFGMVRFYHLVVIMIITSIVPLFFLLNNDNEPTMLYKQLAQSNQDGKVQTVGFCSPVIHPLTKTRPPCIPEIDRCVLHRNYWNTSTRERFTRNTGVSSQSIEKTLSLLAEKFRCNKTTKAKRYCKQFFLNTKLLKHDMQTVSV